MLLDKKKTKRTTTLVSGVQSNLGLIEEADNLEVVFGVEELSTLESARGEGHECRDRGLVHQATSRASLSPIVSSVCEELHMQKSSRLFKNEV